MGEWPERYDRVVADNTAAALELHGVRAIRGLAGADIAVVDSTGAVVTVIDAIPANRSTYPYYDKLGDYRKIPSLQSYVRVETAKQMIDCFRRGDGAWILTTVTDPGGNLKLESIGVSLPLAEIYAGVEFPAVFEEVMQ